MYAFSTRVTMDATATGKLRLSGLVTTYNLNNSSHLSNLWRSCSDKVLVLFCVFRYSSYVCTRTERTSSDTVCNRVSVYASGSCTHSSFSLLTHTYSSNLMTFKYNLTRECVSTTQYRANTTAVTSGASFFSSFAC